MVIMLEYFSQNPRSVDETFSIQSCLNKLDMKPHL